MNNAYHAAQGLLARREHGERELQLKLEKKGFEADAVFEAVSRLKSAGLQSDARYVDGYLNSRKKRGFGPNHIKKALSEKGIDAELIEAKVNSHLWFDVVLNVWLKKFNQFSFDLKIQSKQKQFLYYRGFDTDIINQLFSELSSRREYVDNEKC